MKRNETRPPEDDALNSLLRQWQVDAPLPPRFQEQVWRRITRAEGPQPESAFLAGFSWLMDTLLPRPRFALAYMAILLSAGIAAGSWTAQAKTTRLESTLRQRYIQSVDPYRAAGVQP